MITPDQLANRMNYLGASEIAALFRDPDTGKSLDPFQTAYDVYASKVFPLERPMEESAAMRRGNRYEPALIQYAAEKLNCTIDTDPVRMEYIHPQFSFLVAHLDGLSSLQAPVECKTTIMSDEYGEEMTDQVPLRVNIQAHFQMACSGHRRVYVSALLGRRGAFEGLYQIDWNETVGKAVVDTAVNFWMNHVLTKTPPPESLPGDIEFLKRIRREPKTWADVPSELILKWDEAREKRIAIAKEEEEAFKAVLVMLGDKEGARIPDGRTLTYFSQSRTTVDTKALKETYPQIYEQIAKPSEYRVARIVKAKG